MSELGERLRAERDRKRLTIADVAAATKIRPQLLVAMESGAWEQLPGGIFRRKFLEAYARQLDLNPAETWNAYCRATGCAAETELYLPDPRQMHPRQPQRKQRQRRRQLALAGLLLLGFAAGAWQLRGRVQARTIFAQWLHFWPGRKLTLAARRSAKSPKTSITQPAAAPQFHPSGSLETASVWRHAPNPARPGQPERTMRIAGSNGLKLEVSAVVAPAWISVRADGREVYSGTLQPSQTRGFSARRRLRLVTGNAAATRVRVNGRNRPLSGAAGQIATIVLQTAAASPAGKSSSANPGAASSTLK